MPKRISMVASEQKHEPSTFAQIKKAESSAQNNPQSLLSQIIQQPAPQAQQPSEIDLQQKQNKDSKMLNITEDEIKIRIQEAIAPIQREQSVFEGQFNQIMTFMGQLKQEMQDVQVQRQLERQQADLNIQQLNNRVSQLESINENKVEKEKQSLKNELNQIKQQVEEFIINKKEMEQQIQHLRSSKQQLNSQPFLVADPQSNSFESGSARDILSPKQVEQIKKEGPSKNYQPSKKGSNTKLTNTKAAQPNTNQQPQMMPYVSMHDHNSREQQIDLLPQKRATGLNFNQKEKCDCSLSVLLVDENQAQGALFAKTVKAQYGLDIKIVGHANAAQTLMMSTRKTCCEIRYKIVFIDVTGYTEQNFLAIKQAITFTRQGQVNDLKIYALANGSISKEIEEHCVRINMSGLLYMPFDTESLCKRMDTVFQRNKPQQQIIEEKKQQRRESESSIVQHQDEYLDCDEGSAALCQLDNLAQGPFQINNSGRDQMNFCGLPSKGFVREDEKPALLKSIGDLLKARTPSILEKNQKPSGINFR